MVKFLIKLAVAGLIANATWRLGSAYLQFYKFKDAVAETATFGQRSTEAQIHQRVLELATQYDVPLADVTVQRNDRNHVIIDGSYVQEIQFVPGYQYQWPFTMHVDVLTLVGSLR